MIIVLLGYMASGKSFVGKHLADKLGYRFIDLDQFIEEKEDQSITDIFRNKGEIYFRQLESKYLKHLIDNQNNTVLALGGGTPCYANNMNLLSNSDNCKTFYLKTSITNLVARVFEERGTRPLISHIKNKEELTEFIGKHLFERNNYYNLSEYSISTDDKDVKTILETILFELF